MNQYRTIAALAITGLVGVMPAAAQGKSGTRGAGATPHGRPTTTTATSTTTTTTSTGTSRTTTGQTSRAKGADGAQRGRSADAGTRGSDKSRREAATTTAAPGTATTTTTTPGANALSTKISSQPNQLAKISGMLPQGMTLEQATTGFRNQGQFIAALNASKNQGVPFADLQKAMTVDGMSLGQAVRQLRNAPTSTTTTTTTTTSTTGSTPSSSGSTSSGSSTTGGSTTTATAGAS